MTPQQRININRTGMAMGILLIGILIYSYIVIKTRAKLPEPPNLTKWQKIFRGL